MIDISDKIISLLNENPFAQIDITVEINAVFPGGISNKIRNSIDDNAEKISNFSHEWA